MEDPQRIAAERAAVIPPFPEGEFQVTDRRPVELELSVVPWRPRAVHGRHGLMLTIAVVVFLIAAAMTEVDASHEGDVRVRARHVSHDHQLLVM